MINKIFNMIMQELGVKLSTGGPQASLKKRNKATASFAFPNIHPLVLTFCGYSPAIPARSWSRLAFLLKEVADPWFNLPTLLSHCAVNDFGKAVDLILHWHFLGSSVLRKGAPGVVSQYFGKLQLWIFATCASDFNTPGPQMFHSRFFESRGECLALTKPMSEM